MSEKEKESHFRGIGRVKDSKSEVEVTVEKRFEDKRLEKNPKKFTVMRVGDFEVWCYPYSSSDRIYFGVGGEYQSFEPKMAHEIMDRLRNRLKTTQKRLKRGVSDYDSSESGKRFLEAYNSGLKEIKEKMDSNKERKDSSS